MVICVRCRAYSGQVTGLPLGGCIGSQQERIAQLEADLAALRQRHAEELGNRKCIWAESNGDAEFWHTSCDQDFVFIEGTPSENGMKFCCYCGANLVEKKWEEPPDAEDLSTV